MFKRSLAVLTAAASILILTFGANSVKADQNSNDIQVSTDLVKETMKPQLLKQKLQDDLVAKIQADKLKEVKAEQARMEKQEAQAKAQADAQKKAQQKQASSQAPTGNNASSQAPSGVNKGTFKLSFYDPGVLGSSMGYGGVAANLSVFPKGTKLKITLSDGTVWYKVVNDTGSFAASNPRQLDVAMPNDQVPSAGILYATVEVIG